jgi:dTDP-4-dehydrorhamnose reductase
MKILLLGKKGLLGHEIATTFKRAEQDDFMALGHDDIDITDKDSLFQVLKDVKPNLVINAAAFTFVDECEAKKEFVMTVNGKANCDLAQICNSLNAHLMYFSTDYVFDGGNEEGYKEDDATSPINVYGESKLLGEQLIQQNTDKYYIIRTSWLFGMNGVNFVKTMLDVSQKKSHLTIVDDQIGKPTYTHDLADGIFNFVRNNFGQSGIYHLTNEGSTSWFDFAKKIFEFAKIKVELSPVSSVELNRPAKRPNISILHNTKLPHLRHHHEALKDYLTQLQS